MREVRAAEPRREWPRAASATKTLPSHTIPPATQTKTNYSGSKLALVRYDYWFSFVSDFWVLLTVIIVIITSENGVKHYCDFSTSEFVYNGKAK